MNAAKVISTHKNQIVELWLKELNEQVPEVRNHDKSAIEDDIPDLLDALSQALEAEDPAPLLDAGKAHGEQRINFSEYSLVHVIREYRLLKKVIFSIIDEQGEIEQIKRDRIMFAIDQAIEQSSDHYFRLQKEQMIKTTKEAEENIEKLKNDDRLRDNFISSVSHDLNNPISAIKMVVQILENKSNVNDQEKLLSILKLSASKAEKLIYDLLDVNLVYSGAELPIEIKNCDLMQCMYESMTRYKLQYGDIIQFKTDLQELRLNADCEALQRALDNMIDNAIKYGDNNEPVIIELCRKESNISLSVLNFGKPIPLDKHAQIFSRFYRLENSNKKKKGWGIGLSLIKGIAEAHGGKVSLDSSKSNGTKFTITIPGNKEL